MDEPEQNEPLGDLMHPSSRWIDGRIDPAKLGPLERGKDL
jgi:hypothetical protein